VISSRRVSEVPVNLILMLSIQYKQLPADLLHCFNFFTVSFKMEYLKLSIEVVPAYSNVKRPIFLTSGCFPLIIIDSFHKEGNGSGKIYRKKGLYLQLIPFNHES